MCEYSLSAIANRPAKVGDKLVTRHFGTGTRGFAEANGDPNVAVCCLPGSEIAFDADIKTHIYLQGDKTSGHRVAIFRQINKDQPHMHHDCLELPDGTQLLLTFLLEGQTATVLQLPKQPKTKKEADEQKRLEIAA